MVRKVKLVKSFDRIEHEEEQDRLMFEEHLCVIYHLWKTRYDNMEDFIHITNKWCERRAEPVYITEDNSYNSHYEYPTLADIKRAFDEYVIFRVNEYRGYCTICKHEYKSNRCYEVRCLVTNMIEAQQFENRRRK